MRRYRRRYERDYHYRRSRRPFWEGCLSTWMILISVALFLFLVYVVIAYGKYLLAAIPVLLIVLVAILAIAVIGFVFWLVSVFWSFISDRVTQIRLNRLEVDQRQAELQHRYPQARIREKPVTVQSYARTDALERPVTVQSYARTDYPQLSARNEPVRDHAASAYQHKQIRPVYYHDILPSIERGKILMGIRPNGSIRQGVWNDNKTVLILGTSSSGKTTTAIEKTVSAVLSGALLVICDPHAHKEDSLTRRLYPLKDFLWPGTVFGVKHMDIYRNVQIVLDELNRRVGGGSTKVKLVLVIDEFNRLMRDETIAKDLTKILHTIGQEGRGYNIYAVVLCQQITGNVLLRKSVNSYIVHRVDESEAKLVIPSRYAKYAPELPTGLAIVKDADGLTEYLQQTIVTSELISNLVEAYGEKVRAFKARLRAPQTPREPRPTRDLRKTVDRSTVKLVGRSTVRLDKPCEPEPRYEPVPEPQNRAVWRPSEYIEPEQPYEPIPEPQPGTVWGEPPLDNQPGQEILSIDQPADEPPMISSSPRQNIPLPEEVKEQALAMARAGLSRRKIREATGLMGAKYELLKRLLDSEGL